MSVAAYAPAQQYDLLIINGHVIDPKNKIDAVLDVAVADGKIAKLATGIDSLQSKNYRCKRVVCCAGPY